MNCCTMGEGPTSVDLANAITKGVTDVVGAIGAAVTRKPPVPVIKDMPDGKRIQVGNDYTPYVVVGAAVLIGAGVIGYALYKRSKRPVAANPRRRRKSRR